MMGPARTVTVWTLVTDDEDIAVSVHSDEVALFDSLLAYAAHFDGCPGHLTAETVVEWLTEDAGVCLHIDAHTLEVAR